MRMAVAVILIAELLAIILTLADNSAPQNGFQRLALYSLFIQWVALGSVALLCLLRSRLNRLPDVWSALLSYAVMLAVTLIVTEAAWWLLYVIPTGGIETQLAEHVAFLVRSLGVSSIVSALALRYFYVQHQWRQHIRSEAEARLQALQARIRPHFLFNCMNTIASLTRREPVLAEQATEDLADLFRLALQESPTWLSLAEELDLCRRYLRIEQLRLGERLRLDWQVNDLPGDACLPALLIQPLLENAIYHGIEPLAEGGNITILGERQDGRLSVTIDNPLAAGATPHHRGNQLAQDNIRQRLRGVFGDRAALVTQTEAGRYRIQLQFPYETEPCASS